MLPFKYLHLGRNSLGNYKGINIHGTNFICVRFDLVAFVPREILKKQNNRAL
jgi:hypothetical protein